MVRERCPWCVEDPLMQRYHDEEWGLPLKEEQKLFELLCLEGAQAGLSWRTVLQKREGYRSAFLGFDPSRIAAFDDVKMVELQQDRRIIRSKAKIRAVVGNARALLTLRRSGIDFVDFLWNFVGGIQRHNCWTSGAEIPTETPESQAMGKALRAVGFRFVGPKICYAFMQASGMINDHLITCYRHEEIKELAG